jgi:hypothetical protein
MPPTPTVSRLKVLRHIRRPSSVWQLSRRASSGPGLYSHPGIRSLHRIYMDHQYHPLCRWIQTQGSHVVVQFTRPAAGLIHQ